MSPIPRDELAGPSPRQRAAIAACIAIVAIGVAASPWIATAITGDGPPRPSTIGFALAVAAALLCIAIADRIAAAIGRSRRRSERSGRAAHAPRPRSRW